MNIAQRIAQELNFTINQTKNTIDLLVENTIPFITRYRKEATSNLDEVQIADIHDRYQYLVELNERAEVIVKSIGEQGKLTTELESKIRSAETKQILEDLYLPYKPKRRTRATIAKELGLEPLAKLLLEPSTSLSNAESWLSNLNEEALGTPDHPQGENEEPLSLEDGLKGARDIIAEWIAENAETRDGLRNLMWKQGKLVSSVKSEYAEQKTKFEMYYDFEEAISKVPAHRFMAMRRGEKENVLRVSIKIEEDLVFEKLASKWLAPINGEMKVEVEKSFKESCARLLTPSIETDIRLQLKKQADDASIEIFVTNLRELLLQSPGMKHVTLGLDPGFRTGTKWVVIDETGKFITDGVIYPVPPKNQIEESQKTILGLIEKYKIRIITLGNGTASREVQQFIKGVLKSLENPPHQVIVNESGASVYSASSIAREEFPNLDATVRGAISIARRYQDPLAELVKVDPKSIGVGQYQHDVNQTNLKLSLDRTVESCVNHVGVDANTASVVLLEHVAGLTRTVAKNVVKYRDEHGRFQSRQDLNNITGLGKKSYEQAAGFLKIADAANPLDNSSVHPESYHIVEKIAEDQQLKVATLIGNKEILEQINLDQYTNDQVGLYTMKDIIAELLKPGRDPREDHTTVQFNENIESIDDLQVEMKLNGVVTNITHFGAFVDIGVHQDGLVHISEMSNHYIKNPLDVCKVGQKVAITVKKVDKKLKRISLSMRTEEKKRVSKKLKKIKKDSKSPQQKHADLQSLMSKFNQH